MTTTEPNGDMRPRSGDDPDDGAGRGTGLTSQALRAFLWAVASFGASKTLNFVGTLILARILVPEHFGLVAAGLALVTYFEMALDLGVGSAVIYEQEGGITERVHTAFTLNIALGVLFAAIGMLLAPLVAAFFQAPDETAVFRAMFIYLFVRAAGQVPDAVLRRDLDFRRRLLADLSRAGLRLGVSVPLALAGMGAWSIVIGMIVGEAVGTVVTWFAARFRPSLRFDRAAVRTLLGYGMSMLGVRLVSELSQHGDQLIVGNRLGPDQLGVYSIAYRVPELVLATVFWLYSMVAFSVYSRAGATDPSKLKSAMLRAIRLTTLFAFPAGIGLAIVSHDAIHVLFTDRWEGAILPMALIALAFAVGSVSVASGDVLPSIGQPRILLTINAALLPPLLVGMVLAAPYGLTAVALVQLVGTVVYIPLLQRYVNRALGSSVAEVLVAVRPAVSATLGVIVAAGSVRLLVDEGLFRLVATIVTGGLGAMIGVLVGGRDVLADVRSLLRQAVRR